mmetsp:Transcript_65677/g.140441  ORF Transcript_65677/g.140441 Transcript_65677/m.140441 type:complete len:210 (-) Transcript_65677:195-824(-)
MRGISAGQNDALAISRARFAEAKKMHGSGNAPKASVQKSEALQLPAPPDFRNGVAKTAWSASLAAFPKKEVISQPFADVRTEIKVEGELFSEEQTYSAFVTKDGWTEQVFMDKDTGPYYIEKAQTNHERWWTGETAKDGPWSLRRFQDGAGAGQLQDWHGGSGHFGWKQWREMTKSEREVSVIKCAQRQHGWRNKCGFEGTMMQLMGLA